MTTLLPSNSTSKEHALDALATKKLNIDLTVIDINAATCDEKLLPWLAKAWRLDITGLSINEQRVLIANATESHKYKGTVYAAQQALNAVFSNAQVQQFKDPAKPYEFSAKVSLSADATRVYNTAKFDTAKRLVDEAKNLGSRFAGFDIVMPDAKANINQDCAAILTPKMVSDLTLHANNATQIEGYVQWML